MVKVGPSSMVHLVVHRLMLIGLIWLMVFQLAAIGSQPHSSLDGATPVPGDYTSRSLS